jgi:putative transposase
MAREATAVYVRGMNKLTPYPSSLTDAEWAVLEALLPPPAPVGRKRTIERRAIVDALLYRLVTGCQWRQLPSDFPGWSTVHQTGRRWRLAGVWERILAVLVARDRVAAGRDPEPSAAVLDSQSVRVSAGQRGGSLSAASTPASRSGAASATWPSTSRAACSPSA